MGFACPYRDCTFVGESDRDLDEHLAIMVRINDPDHEREKRNV